MCGEWDELALCDSALGQATLSKTHIVAWELACMNCEVWGSNTRIILIIFRANRYKSLNRSPE